LIALNGSSEIECFNRWKGYSLVSKTNSDKRLMNIKNSWKNDTFLFLKGFYGSIVMKWILNKLPDTNCPYCNNGFNSDHYGVCFTPISFIKLYQNHFHTRYPVAFVNKPVEKLLNKLNKEKDITDLYILAMIIHNWNQSDGYTDSELLSLDIQTDQFI
jgi:hypothetical protein